MRDEDGSIVHGHDARDLSDNHEADAAPEETGLEESEPEFDESLSEEISALIDDGKTYVEAEIAFQKTRASIAGKSIGSAAACVIVAIVTLHVAILALAVGLVIALDPLVTIWGAIAIVVGVLLFITAILVRMAMKHANRLGLIFGNPDEDQNA